MTAHLPERTFMYTASTVTLMYIHHILGSPQGALATTKYTYTYSVISLRQAEQVTTCILVVVVFKQCTFCNLRHLAFSFLLKQCTQYQHDAVKCTHLLVVKVIIEGDLLVRKLFISSGSRLHEQQNTHTIHYLIM